MSYNYLSFVSGTVIFARSVFTSADIGGAREGSTVSNITAADPGSLKVRRCSN